MGPLFSCKRVVLGLVVAIGCDGVATREAAPIAVMAAAPAGLTRAEKAARKAEKAARAEKVKRAEQAKAKDKPAKGEKPAKPEKVAKPETAARLEKVARPERPASPGVALPACPQDNALTYRSFGAGFLRTWCTGCHSSTLAEADRQDAPGDVNFDRPDFYKKQAQQVYERAVLGGHKFVADPGSASPMPPAGLVPANDLRRLGQWIACGSPGA